MTKMLPSAKKSMMAGGMTKREASFAQIGLFLVGAIGIQIVSRIMHQWLPSHVVDCDHTHEEDEQGSEMNDCSEDEESSYSNSGKADSAPRSAASSARGFVTGVQSKFDNGLGDADSTMQPKPWSNILSTSNKARCDENGRCYGYTDPCGLDCFRNVQARQDSFPSRPNMPRSATTTDVASTRATEVTPLLPPPIEENRGSSSSSTTLPPAFNSQHARSPHSHHSQHSHVHEPALQHHHHVPKNAFMSIGLQTSLAIALHKLPEGFITYFTNHANPRLGFTVFLSLFVHNITEGIALALPLYLALRSRTRALLWTAILGGASQPIGAAIAALWFRVSGDEGIAGGEAVYGGIFALVAGIMANVGLQLMGEAWALGHSKGLCLMFAFLGMGILGFSSALSTP